MKTYFVSYVIKRASCNAVYGNTIHEEYNGNTITMASIKDIELSLSKYNGVDESSVTVLSWQEF